MNQTNDRHPSLYISDDHYHCFACGEHGDVIDLTAKLFDLRLYDAARKLASDFHLVLDKPLPESIRQKLKHKTKAQQLRENEQLCFSVLNQYGHLCPALAYGVVMKLQNLLFVRSCVPDRVQPVIRAHLK